MRPDYCPQANEPCQAICEKPCAPIGRLKVEKLEPLSREELMRALVSVDADTKRLPPGFVDFARAVEAAHNAKLGGAG